MLHSMKIRLIASAMLASALLTTQSMAAQPEADGPLLDVTQKFEMLAVQGKKTQVELHLEGNKEVITRAGLMIIVEDAKFGPSVILGRTSASLKPVEDGKGNKILDANGNETFRVQEFSSPIGKVDRVDGQEGSPLKLIVNACQLRETTEELGKAAMELLPQAKDLAEYFLVEDGKRKQDDGKANFAALTNVIIPNGNNAYIVGAFNKSIGAIPEDQREFTHVEAFPISEIDFGAKKVDWGRLPLVRGADEKEWRNVAKFNDPFLEAAVQAYLASKMPKAEEEAKADAEAAA